MGLSGRTTRADHGAELTTHAVDRRVDSLAWGTGSEPFDVAIRAATPGSSSTDDDLEGCLETGVRSTRCARLGFLP